MKYVAIRSEGGLIPYDLLDKIATEDVPGQKASDFGLAKGRRLSDEIQRVWSDAQDLWDIFHRRRDSLPEKDPHGTTLTRERWIVPLLTDPQILAYSLTYQPSAIVLDGLTFPISHLAGESEESPPVDIEGFKIDLDHRAPKLRTSPRAMVQEFLNHSEAHLWGIVTNGLSFRLLRDTARTSRPSYLDFNLERILTDGLYHEFAVFYRLCHRTRLPLPGQLPEACLLDEYYKLSIEQGGRVRDKLRDGVEETLKIFGTGFLRHPDNQPLRDKIASGSLNVHDYHRQLLRLVYRLLFLIVAEERRMIVATGDHSDKNQRIYADYYSVGRLRERAEGIIERSDFGDLWIGLKTTFSLFSDSSDRNPLDIPPLNGDLFSNLTMPDLDGTSLYNHDLLLAIRKLSLFHDGKLLQRVNYSALDVEELGSVYESLLDYRPAVEAPPEGLEFKLETGGERKSTGSYYTRPELVRELIQSALVPALEDRLAEAAKEARTKHADEKQLKEGTILSISVCDPACGSGHFLLEAARRLGKELARVRTGEDEPSLEQFHLAVRDVVSHCIYGVDLNPLAVDLCKLALWLEGHWTGKPLSFLDHRIKCGHSLIGVFDLDIMAGGIPDDAFNQVTGDDKKVAAAYKKRNRNERVVGQKRLDFEKTLPDHEGDFAALFGVSLDFPEETPADVRRKSELFDKARNSKEWWHDWTAANLWTATFFTPLVRLDDPDVATHETFMDYLLRGRDRPQTTGNANALATHFRFFHWQLEFPDVFAKGGFDVLLGNAPWERIKLQEEEFWSQESYIESAPNKAERTKRINEYRQSTDPAKRALVHEFDEAKHAAEALSKFVRESRRFPLTARGDINTYALFAELGRSLICRSGCVGIIVQSGIATDDTYQDFFADLISTKQLVSLFDFVNLEGFFPGVHRTHPHFCALTLRGAPQDAPVPFAFYLTRTDQLRDQRRIFELSSQDFQLLNPNTRTCSVFRTHSDAELTKKMYGHVPILVNEQTGGNPWGVRFLTMFHMSNDSNLFRTGPDLRLLPLYEAKMMHQFDHRFATYDNGETRDCTDEEKADPNFAVCPRYWVPEEEVFYRVSNVPPDLITAVMAGSEDLARQIITLWLSGYCAERGDTTAANTLLEGARTKSVLWYSVQSILTERLFNEAAARALQRDYPLTADDIALMDKADDYVWMARVWIAHRVPRWLLAFRDITNATNERTAIFTVLPFSAVGNNAPLLFTKSVDSTLLTCLLANLNALVFDYVARQKVGGTHLNFFIVNQLPALAPEQYCISDISFIRSRVIDLVYVAHDMQSFATDLGFDAPLVTWNRDRRTQVRAELDGYYAHLYRLTRDELRYVLDPKEVFGEDFPSETFRVLKEREEKEFGEYRTRRLVLAAFDELSRTERFRGEKRDCTITGKTWEVGS